MRDIISRENKAAGKPPVGLDEMLEGVNKRGFNTVIHGWRTPSDEFMNRAQAHGLKVFGEIGCPDESTLLAEVRRLKSFPGYIGYYIVREPGMDRIGKAEEIYRQIKRRDPTRLITTAIHSSAGLIRSTFADLINPVVYPIRSLDSPLDAVYETLSYCGSCVIGGGSHADESKSLIVTLQLFTAGIRSGVPTPEQVRAMTYLGVVGGAKGFLYNAYYTHEELNAGTPDNPIRKHWYLPESPLWDYMGRLNQEVASLKDVILFGEVIDAEVKLVRPGQVKRLVLMRGDYTYFFLVNPRPAPTGNLTLKGITLETFQPLFDSPAIRKTGDGAAVQLTGYGVGVYRRPISDGIPD